VALSVTFAPLATGLAGTALALMDGGVVFTGGAIGTDTVATAAIEEFPPPTLTWNVRFLLAATVGAVKVDVNDVGPARVTVGSAGEITCVHTNGPLVGVLPAALSVTSVPPTIGFAAAV
jgi:hypothetical protein